MNIPGIEKGLFTEMKSSVFKSAQYNIKTSQVKNKNVKFIQLPLPPLPRILLRHQQ